MGEYHLDFFFVFGNMSLQKLFPNICQCNICQFLTESQEQPGWQPLQKCQDISHQNCLHFGVVGTILTLGVADFPNLRQTCELEAWNRMNKQDDVLTVVQMSSRVRLQKEGHLTLEQHGVRTVQVHLHVDFFQ